MESLSPTMIALTGIMGTGKTTLARFLCEQLPNHVRMNTDEVRRILGKEKFDPADTPKVNEHIYLTMRLLFSEHRGVVSDSANKTKIVRERLYTLARESKAPIVVIECVCNAETSIRRITARPPKGTLHQPTNKAEDYHAYVKLCENIDADVADAAHKDILFLRYHSDTQKIDVLSCPAEKKKRCSQILQLLERFAKKHQPQN